MNWRALDLNLLRVLDGMLIERSTVRVAELLGLSQPAISAALNRLRQVLGDALFVREGNRMVATPFAASLETPLREALARIERTLSGKAFDPAKSTRRFRMLWDDLLSEMLLPKLIRLFADEAPGVRFQLLPMSPRPLTEHFAEGNIDLALWIAEETPGWIQHVPAFHSAPIIIASDSNERLLGAGIKPGAIIPIELYCELAHVFFSPRGNLGGWEDEALAKTGRQRRIMLTVPDFFSLGTVVAQTQLIGLLPAPFALSIAKRFGLCVYAKPFEMPLIPLDLYWHDRHSDDPEHRWLREHILGLLEPLDALRHPISLVPTKRTSGSPRRNRARRSG